MSLTELAGPTSTPPYTDPPSHSCLSDKAILYHKQAGNIVIEPFDPASLGTGSYDVRLGPFFYRERDPRNADLSSDTHLVNTFHPLAPSQVWGTLHHGIAASLILKSPMDAGVNPDDEVIVLHPGETILGHTEEFIGGRNNVTSMMKTRSSAGRYMLSMCLCAGLGDHGYVNRYTMEITNRSRWHDIVLVVGRRYAQIVFFQTDSTLRQYTSGGKYQTATDLSTIISTWHPSMMLPRMHLDREAKAVIENGAKSEIRED